MTPCDGGREEGTARGRKRKRESKEGMNEEREGQSKKGKITRGLQITKQIHMQMQSHTVKVYNIHNFMYDGAQAVKVSSHCNHGFRTCGISTYFSHR